uniref:uncharacterized protein LOC122610197 n=1 Tax=Erigeron canadensis TaxID=72917 RepID=UPI001CB91FAF|nr:uncharacterized protein LOC122610197 [Erigeron canadensis]
MNSPLPEATIKNTFANQIVAYESGDLHLASIITDLDALPKEMRPEIIFKEIGKTKIVTEKAQEQPEGKSEAAQTTASNKKAKLKKPSPQSSSQVPKGKKKKESVSPTEPYTSDSGRAQPKDNSTEANPSGSSQQELEELSQRTSLGGDGEGNESVSAQHTLEFESAHAPPVTSHILHSLDARTNDVSQVTQAETKAPNSTANDEVLDDSIRITEATFVSAVAGKDASAEPIITITFNDASASELVVKPEEDEPIQGNLDSLVDFEFDEELLEENQSFDSEPAFNLANAPPLPKIQNLEQPYQQPPISHQHPFFPQGSTPTYTTSPTFQPSLQFLHPQNHNVPKPINYDEPSKKELDSATESESPTEMQIEQALCGLGNIPFVDPASAQPPPPLSVEAQLEKQYAEVQSLLLKVEDLTKSLTANTTSIADMKGAQMFIATELIKVAGNEGLVGGKLNELVHVNNKISLAIREAFRLTKRDVQASVVANLTSGIELIKQEVMVVGKEVNELVKKPIVDVTVLGSSIGGDVFEKLKSELSQNLVAQISVSVAEKVEEKIKEMVAELTKDTNEKMDKAINEVKISLEEILTLLKKEQVVAPSVPSFTEDDRKQLQEVVNKEALNLNSNFRLRSQFAQMSKGLADCLKQQSWDPLKGMQMTIEEFAKLPSEVPKGGRDPVPIRLLASTQEFIQATMKQTEPEPARKDKGKAPVVDEPKSKGSKGSGLVVGENVDEYGYPLHDTEADSKKLEALQKQVSNQYIMWRENKERERAQHLSMGSLDHIDVAALGLTLERYQKIKNDPTVQKAMLEMGDYEYGIKYSPFKQKLDHLTFKLSVEDLVKNREKDMAIKKKEIMAEVLKVEKQLARPPMKPKVTGPRSARKSARDADLSTFKPMSEDTVQIQNKHENDQYEHYMKHRSNPAKILDVDVVKEDGLRLFDLVVKIEERVA